MRAEPMRRAIQLIAGTLIVLCSALLTGCSREEAPVVVWSNVPEISFVLERYGLVTTDEVRFRYVDNLTEALTQERTEADVVIGRWVNTPPVNRLMINTGSYVLWGQPGGEPAAGTSTVASAIDRELAQRSPQWIPLSFTLPAAVFLPERHQLRQRFSATLEDFSDLYSRERPPIHFAPSAGDYPSYALHRSFGFMPSVGPSGEPSLDPEELESIRRRIEEWRTEWNGGREDEQRYVERYLYERPLRRLDTERISAVLLRSDRLFTWSFFNLREYAFAWLAGPDGEITAGEDVVYAGIPTAVDQHAGAVRLLTWLTNPSVQVELTAAKLDARIESFGFLGGFSTVEETNRRIAREIYPDLEGRIPQPRAVRFSGPLPRYWNEARRAVVMPFLRGNASSTELASELERWYRQRGD